MRLIDGDELTRRIEQSYLTKGEKRLFSVKVRHMPTADLDDFYGKAFRNGEENALKIRRLEEKPQGEWKVKTLSTFPQYQPDEYMCPFCNKVVNYKTNYCPDCGADMRGGEDNG